MADYDGQWIAQLNPADPTGTERKSLGDNAIREIKVALTNAFPNSTISDAYLGTLSQLNDLVTNTTLPRDLIAMWAGSAVTSPAGWTICDGRARQSGGGVSPDLTDRFIMGTGTQDTGTTGGQDEFKARFANTQFMVFNTSSTSLTTQQLPAMTTSFPLTLGGGGNSGINHTNSSYFSGGEALSTTVTRSVNGTGGQGHSHTFVIDSTGSGTNPNRPPYYRLAYIIKD